MFEELRSKLPREAKSAPQGVALDDPDTLRAIVEEVESELLQRLVEEHPE